MYECSLTSKSSFSALYKSFFGYLPSIAQERELRRIFNPVDIMQYAVQDFLLANELDTRITASPIRSLSSFSRNQIVDYFVHSERAIRLPLSERTFQNSRPTLTQRYPLTRSELLPLYRFFVGAPFSTSTR
jgi:hypothetical protein